MNDEKPTPADNSADHSVTPAAVALQPTPAIFAIGELVALRSDPKVVVPVIQTLIGNSLFEETGTLPQISVLP